MNEAAAVSRAGRTCLLCGRADRSVTLFTSTRAIMACRACGLVFADRDAPVPLGDYPREYFQGGPYADYVADEPAVRRTASARLQHLETVATGRRLLDVGCATGAFLEVARKRGWHVHGLERSAYAVEIAQQRLGNVVEGGSITDDGRVLPAVDVITLWDTLEHLDRPDEALARVRAALSPGGLVALSTGDYGSLLRRITGRRWRLFADPTHNFFFTEHTLTAVLTRVGLLPIAIWRSGKWVSLSLILHQLRHPLATRVRNQIVRRGWEPSLFVNLWDTMTVYARSAEES
jgi:SAM-dependent methyltransferase